MKGTIVFSHSNRFPHLPPPLLCRIGVSLRKRVLWAAAYSVRIVMGSSCSSANIALIGS